MRTTAAALLLAGLALVPTALLAFPVHAGSAPESELEELMYVLKRHLKGASTALQDPTQEAAALEHIAELQKAALAAKLLAPANLDELPEDERDQHTREFRRDMAKVLGVLVAMEIDVLEGHGDKAMARVVDPLFPMREAAHEKYQSE